MIGLEEDCLLALVNERNMVEGSVSLSEYKKNPSKYNVFCIRVILMTEEREFILSPGSFFEESLYDTSYCTIIKYKEDYATAFERIKKALPNVDLHFIMQYKSDDEKYNLNVRLYLGKQNKEEAKANQERVVLYPSDIGTDDIIENNILFSEIDFIKEGIFSVIDSNNIKN